MRFAVPEGSPPIARWTTRAALFSFAVLVAALFLHRLFGMSTPIALNLFTLAFLGAVLTLVLGVMAALRIWRAGGGGAARVFAGTVMALGILAWPLAYLPTVHALPMLNDVTTDTADPPRFVALASRRGKGTNSADYPGEPFAKLQAIAYADLEPIDLPRSTTEAFELSADTLRNKLGMSIVREQAPDPGSGRPGFIEAVDQTLIVGFYDDVAVRVVGDASRARIDVRSASRYGRHDLGQNAERVRRVLKEIVAQVEATLPVANAVTLKSREERAKVKQTKQKQGRRKRSRDRDR